MRRHAFSDAQSQLEDAIEQWPTDRRFLRPLALLYAMAGRAPEAVALLQQTIASNPDDVESLALALEWLYSVHRDGQTLRSQSDDVQMARTYAAQYLKAGGPDEALVRRWQAYFEQQQQQQP
ncbi:MAG: tetratricopeptide repeat protein [Vicinamibacterales bacterium]